MKARGIEPGSAHSSICVCRWWDLSLSAVNWLVNHRVGKKEVRKDVLLCWVGWVARGRRVFGSFGLFSNGIANLAFEHLKWQNWHPYCAPRPNKHLPRSPYAARNLPHPRARHQRGNPHAILVATMMVMIAVLYLPWSWGRGVTRDIGVGNGCSAIVFCRIFLNSL